MYSDRFLLFPSADTKLGNLTNLHLLNNCRVVRDLPLPRRTKAAKQ